MASCADLVSLTKEYKVALRILAVEEHYYGELNPNHMEILLGMLETLDTLAVTLITPHRRALEAWVLQFEGKRSLSNHRKY